MAEVDFSVFGTPRFVVQKVEEALIELPKGHFIEGV